MYSETSPDFAAQPGHATPLDEDRLAAQVRRLNRWAVVVLVPVAMIGAALSFRSLYAAALPTFGPILAAGFPLLVDFLILGASLRYVAGAKVGRARAGWRLTAHAGVAGTLLLNALAAHSLGEVPWHVTAPAVWSVLVEMAAREVLGEYKATHHVAADRIPLRLWLTAPIESARTWLRMARVGAKAHTEARRDVGIHAAANEALRLALPRWRDRRVRKILRRQLRAGSLPPAAVLGPLGWADQTAALLNPTGATVLRAALRDVLLPPGSVPPVDTEPAASPAVIDVRTTDYDQTDYDQVEPADHTDATDTGGQAEETPPEGSASPALRAVVGEPRRQQAATGDRLQDAIAALQARSTMTAPELHAELRGLGWELSERTAGRVLQDAKQRLDETRLAAFR